MLHLVFFHQPAIMVSAVEPRAGALPLSLSKRHLSARPERIERRRLVRLLLRRRLRQQPAPGEEHLEPPIEIRRQLAQLFRCRPRRAHKGQGIARLAHESAVQQK